LKLSDLEPLPASPFFTLEHTLAYEIKKPKRWFASPYLLPDINNLTLSDSAPLVSVVELKNALVFALLFEEPFETGEFPKFRNADCVEIFINTRPDIEINAIHQYCHHFVFLPEDRAEVTKFRTDETHEMASIDLLHLNRFEEMGIECTIDKNALYGLRIDSAELAFAIRIHQGGMAKMAYPHSNSSVNFDRYPKLWATFKREAV